MPERADFLSPYKPAPPAALEAAQQAAQQPVTPQGALQAATSAEARSDDHGDNAVTEFAETEAEAKARQDNPTDEQEIAYENLKPEKKDAGVQTIVVRAAAEQKEAGEENLTKILQAKYKYQLQKKEDDHVREQARRFQAERNAEEQADKLKQAEENLRMMRVMALEDLVEEITVETAGGLSSTMRRVFLKNKQAMLFTPPKVVDLLAKMSITSVPMVIFISGSKHTRASRNKVQGKNWGLSVQSWENNHDAPTEAESIANERQIMRFVDSVLMPFVIENKALVVVSTGTNGCSLSVAIGRAFETLRSQRSVSEGPGPRLLLVVATPMLMSYFLEDFVKLKAKVDAKAATADAEAATADAEAATAADNADGQDGQRRRKSIASRVLFASATGAATSAAAEVPREAGSTSSKQSFVDEAYLFDLLWHNPHLLSGDGIKRAEKDRKKEYLQELRGLDFTYQYDLIDGATDVIFIDCLDADTCWYTTSAMTQVEQMIMQAYSVPGSRQVPSAAIAFAGASDGLAPLVDLKDRKVPLLLVDTRVRKLLPLQTEISFAERAPRNRDRLRLPLQSEPPKTALAEPGANKEEERESREKTPSRVSDFLRNHPFLEELFSPLRRPTISPLRRPTKELFYTPRGDIAQVSPECELNTSLPRSEQQQEQPQGGQEEQDEQDEQEELLKTWPKSCLGDGPRTMSQYTEAGSRLARLYKWDLFLNSRSGDPHKGVDKLSTKLQAHGLALFAAGIISCVPVQLMSVQNRQDATRDKLLVGESETQMPLLLDNADTVELRNFIYCIAKLKDRSDYLLRKFRSLSPSSALLQLSVVRALLKQRSSLCRGKIKTKWKDLRKELARAMRVMVRSLEIVSAVNRAQHEARKQYGLQTDRQCYGWTDHHDISLLAYFDTVLRTDVKELAENWLWEKGEYLAIEFSLELLPDCSTPGEFFEDPEHMYDPEEEEGKTVMGWGKDKTYMQQQNKTKKINSAEDLNSESIGTAIFFLQEQEVVATQEVRNHQYDVSEAVTEMQVVFDWLLARIDELKAAFIFFDIRCATLPQALGENKGLLLCTALVSKETEAHLKRAPQSPTKFHRNPKERTERHEDLPLSPAKLVHQPRTPYRSVLVDNLRRQDPQLVTDWSTLLDGYDFNRDQLIDESELTHLLRLGNIAKPEDEAKEAMKRFGKDKLDVGELRQLLTENFWANHEEGTDAWRNLIAIEETVCRLMCMDASCMDIVNIPMSDQETLQTREMIDNFKLMPEREKPKQPDGRLIGIMSGMILRNIKPIFRSYLECCLNLYEALLNEDKEVVMRCRSDHRMLLQAFQDPLEHFTSKPVGEIARIASLMLPAHPRFAQSALHWRNARELLNDGQRAGIASLGLRTSTRGDDFADTSCVIHSGSIHDLDRLGRVLREVCGNLNRLPGCCSLTALLVLREAWDEIDVCELFAERNKRYCKWSFRILLLFSVATTTVSTFSATDDVPAAKLDAVGLTPQNFEWILLSLSLATSIAVSLIVYMNAATKWQKLRSAALVLRSEIWQFRTRTGPYAWGAFHGGNRNQMSNVMPARVLREKVKEMRELVLEGAGIQQTDFLRSAHAWTFKHGQYLPIDKTQLSKNQSCAQQLLIRERNWQRFFDKRLFVAKRTLSRPSNRYSVDQFNLLLRFSFGMPIEYGKYAPISALLGLVVIFPLLHALRLICVLTMGLLRSLCCLSVKIEKCCSSNNSKEEDGDGSEEEDDLLYLQKEFNHDRGWENCGLDAKFRFDLRGRVGMGCRYLGLAMVCAEAWLWNRLLTAVKLPVILVCLMYVHYQDIYFGVRHMLCSVLSRKASVGPESKHLRANTVDAAKDQHHKPLQPHEYIALRLETALVFYQRRLTPYSFWANIWHVAILLLSVGSVVLSQLSLTGWIPIVTSVTAGVTAWNEFTDKQRKLMRCSSAVVALRNVRLWWGALQEGDRNASSNIEKLVSTVEEIVGGEGRAWLATAQAAKKLAELSTGGESKKDGEGKKDAE